MIPLRLLPSPSEELAALSLKQVRRENAFGIHLAFWIAGSAFIVAMTAATGFREPATLRLIPIWGALVAIHGWLSLVHRRKIYQRRHGLVADQERRKVEERAEEQGAGLLRGKLLRAADAARAVLRKLSPDTVAEVSRGEAEALASVAWLLETEPLLATRPDPALRLEIAKRLSAPGHRGGVPLKRRDREPLERLLGRLDHHDSQLARLEREVAERQGRVESFLLTIANVELASTESAISPAVSASIRERVARLEAGDGETPEQTAARIAKEVRLAGELQRSILPETAPLLDGLAVAHAYRPSSEVGGDFYDFYTPAPGRLLVALGDASGHGLDASMVSSMAKSALYLQVAAGADPSTAMAEINRMMFDTLGRRRLMSLALLDVDLDRRSLTLANAGQLYPLRVRDGRVSELELPSYPLGVRRDASYTMLRGSLAPGDRLFLFTDGYVEAAGAGGVPFGWDRLTARLASLGDVTPDRAVELLLADLTDYLGPAPAADDVTLIAIAAHDHQEQTTEATQAAQATAR